MNALVDINPMASARPMSISSLKELVALPDVSQIKVPVSDRFHASNGGIILGTITKAQALTLLTSWPQSDIARYRVTLQMGTLTMWDVMTRLSPTD